MKRNHYGQQLRNILRRVDEARAGPRQRDDQQPERDLADANCYRLLGKPEAVKLAFSRDLQTIAVTPCSPRLSEAFPVQTKSTSGRRINAAPFCRHFRIHIDSTLRFLDPYIDPEGTLHLDLRKVVSVAQVRRTRKANVG